MSTFIVNKEHIAYLVDSAHLLARRYGDCFSWWTGERNCLDHRNRKQVGQMLWDENMASVCFAYPDCTLLNMPCKMSDAPFVFDSPNYDWGVIDPLQVIKACECYAYQSCEHEGWKDSSAKAFVDTLKSLAVQSIKGYDDLKWGSPEPLRELRTL